MRQVTLILFFALLILACTEEKTPAATNKSAPSLNPNGDSELAILMRNMVSEAEKMKQQIANNEPVSMNIDHRKILTANATEPEKAASPEYRAFASAYLQTIEKFNTATQEQMPELYDMMIGSCISCHKELCPGPLVKIEQL